MGFLSFLVRVLTAPVALVPLTIKLWRLQPDLAICAMPGPLDLLMGVALRLLGVRLLVIVHEAEVHPGDGYPFQMTIQRLLCRHANALVALSNHVGSKLQEQGIVVKNKRPLIALTHPPFLFGFTPLVREDGPPRLLLFGRLLSYKGLDLLASAIKLLPPSTEISVRIVGQGPESDALSALRASSNVVVENRWVAEAEVGEILGWADALILPYREASQSGVAAAAIASGRTIIATRVGGLEEQLSGFPKTMLCEPDPVSLACTIAGWLGKPLESQPQVDATFAWRQAASGLLNATQSPAQATAPKRRWKRPLRSMFPPRYAP
jgi:glycosyltransferase involved in cell wall biosynthesis